jgi:hypothetical protein
VPQHWVAHASHRLHSGNRCDTLEKQAVHGADLSLAVTSKAGVDRNLKKPIGIEADILARQVLERLDEKPCADEQHHRKTYLASHQHAAQPTHAPRRRG